MSSPQKKKILIIRLSSMGDIIQALAAPDNFKAWDPNCEIHWVSLTEFAELISWSSNVARTWPFARQGSYAELMSFCDELAKENFTHIYDAHNNLRSHLMLRRLKSRGFKGEFIRRSKNRWKRFLLFGLGINKFPQPFYGTKSFLKPLTKWGVSTELLPAQVNDLKVKLPEGLGSNSTYITLAPSANWEMKRWPIEHWTKLIKLLPSSKFFILGGPDDNFCQDIADIAPERCTNLAGQLTWQQSAQVIFNSTAVVSGDTGLLHLADHFEKPAIALIGPTAFGFPSRSSSHILEVPLDCRPCTKDGRGSCKNAVYKKCLIDINPEQVAEKLKNILINI